jgi:phage gpG-like protein
MREFNILESLVKMAEVAMAIEEETHKALERAAKVVEKEAKAEIGHYQKEAEAFPEWAPLAETTLEGFRGHPGKIDLGYSPPDNPLLRTGDLRDSIGHTVQGHEAVVGSNSDIAVYQELGTSRGIPPRSFLGGAAVRKVEEVVEILGEGVVSGIVGGKLLSEA